jgi:hypothetical protein
MSNLKELINKCKASVTIDMNQHRDSYQTVKEYMEEKNLYIEDLINDIEPSIYEQMQKSNTIIEIQAYPNTPIGSYTIFHYDIDEAIKMMLNTI